MSKKSFSPIDVRVDELQLSLLGYDIADAQARLVVEYNEWDKEYSYEVHWSIRGRFDEGEWRDRYTRGAPSLVPILRVPEMGAGEITYYIGQHDKAEKNVKISDRHDLWTSKKKVDASGVSATLTAYDVADVDFDLVPIEKKSRRLPIEVNAEPAACGCAPRLDQVHSSIGQEPGGDERFVQLLLSGSIELCGMDKEKEEYRSGLEYRSDTSYRYTEDHQLPKLGIEVLDGSGFLLEEDDSVIDLDAEVDRVDGQPMRQPRWLTTRRMPLDRFSAEPARVIARFRGNGVS